MNIIGKVIGWMYRFADKFWIHSFGRRVSPLADASFNALYAIPFSPNMELFGIDEPDEIRIEASYDEAAKLQVGSIVMLDDNSTWCLIQKQAIDTRYFGVSRIVYIGARYREAVVSVRETANAAL